MYNRMVFSLVSPRSRCQMIVRYHNPLHRTAALNIYIYKIFKTKQKLFSLRFSLDPQLYYNVIKQNLF